MTVKKLSFGDVLPGLLSDDADVSLTGATLFMQEPNGVQVDIPYIHRSKDAQFAAVDAWFESQTPPENLTLRTADGTVTLFGVQWRGHSVRTGHSLSLGKLNPHETLLHHREAPLGDPLTVKTMRSYIDGLNEWSRFRAVEWTPETNEQNRVKKITVTVESKDELTWTQGEATVSIRPDWGTERPENESDHGLNISEWVVLETEFPDARPFKEHLDEHRKILNLLTLMFGTGIHFRRHKVQDDLITHRHGGFGEVYQNPFVELVSAWTVRDYGRPTPTSRQLDRPNAYMNDLGSEGLQRWATEHHRWRRFIYPTVGAISRTDAYAEDVVVSTSMSVEVAGHLLGEQEGEHETHVTRGKRSFPTTATHFYRCLKAVDVDWGGVSDDLIGMARGLARTYNDVKHYANEDYDERHVLVAMDVNLLLVRFVALLIAAPDGSLLKQFRQEGAQWSLGQTFKSYKLRFDGEGFTDTEPDSSS